MSKLKSIFTFIVNSKWLCAVLMITSSAYTTWILSFGNPLKYEGTLSYIGYSRPLIFWSWGLLTEIALLIGITQMYKKFGYNGKLGKVSLELSIIFIFLTLFIPLSPSNITLFVLHCSSAIAFFATVGFSILIFFISNYKKNQFFATLTYIIASILTIITLLTLLFGENGLLEAIPLWLSFMIVGFANYSNVFETNAIMDKRKENQKEYTTVH